MCVAAFGEIVELNGKSAVVSFRGVMKEVSVVLLPKAKKGDNVVVHAGFATEIIKDMQKLYQDVVATDAIASQLLDAIKRENQRLNKPQLRVMNFCGTHQNTIVQYGLQELLPENIRLTAGPGCPVCVTPEEEIALGLEAAKKNNVIITTYGDLIKVPTQWGSLEQLKAEGADIRIVYDINQALQIARDTKKEVVHFAVGFETTAPSTASIIKEAENIENFSIISSHRITPPAMEYVLEHSELDALLCPGHVAMVTGMRPFDQLCKKYKVPCVISGFEPVDVLQSILKFLLTYGESNLSVVNQYSNVVGEEGNTLARSLIDEVFTLEDANWRGVGTLPKSRLVLKDEYNRYNAENKFGLQMPKTKESDNTCMCGEVLKGKEPMHCPNFGKSCTPYEPKGPCMVSNEGSCSIAYMNKRNKIN